MIAALYVQADGAYSNLPGVDVWDEKRDARKYAGPHPVVAHPPCARWSQLAGLVESKGGGKRGEDGGCFAAALNSVRRWGGVLEHPAGTAAWPAFDLPPPSRFGQWGQTLCGGHVCYVEQGRYGHMAQKATWLYAFDVALPRLRWGYGLQARYVVARSRREKLSDARRLHMPKRLRHVTPPEFRDLLIGMARSRQGVTQ